MAATAAAMEAAAATADTTTTTYTTAANSAPGSRESTRSTGIATNSARVSSVARIGSTTSVESAASVKSAPAITPATTVPAAVIPWPGTDKDATKEPARPVIAIWRASIGIIGVIAPLADWGTVNLGSGNDRGADSNIHPDILSPCRYRERHSQQHCQKNQPKSPHKSSLCRPLHFLADWEPEANSVFSTAGSWASLPRTGFCTL
jgi:hypothetical protein